MGPEYASIVPMTAYGCQGSLKQGLLPTLRSSMTLDCAILHWKSPRTELLLGQVLSNLTNVGAWFRIPLFSIPNGIDSSLKNPTDNQRFLNQVRGAFTERQMSVACLPG